MRALLLVAATVALAACSGWTPEQSADHTGPSPTVAVKYKGPTGFDIAARKANDYCRQHYGGTNARLLADDMKGHARFECVD
jgi:hypothetical protein